MFFPERFVKRLTRRQADAWFRPIRQALAEMRDDNVDSINGRVALRLGTDTYAYVDQCLQGFVRCLRRIDPAAELSALTGLQATLAANESVTVPAIDAAYRTLNELSGRLIKLPWSIVRDALQAEQIAIEADRLGLTSNHNEANDEEN
jgi:hypothetical protein